VDPSSYAFFRPEDLMTPLKSITGNHPALKDDAGPTAAQLVTVLSRLMFFRGPSARSLQSPHR
jgi:hypothetical protein